MEPVHPVRLRAADRDLPRRPGPVHGQDHHPDRGGFPRPQPGPQAARRARRPV